MEGGQNSPVGQDVQQTALNGSQVSSLLEVVQTVRNGGLPAESALGLLQVAFPSISLEQARGIINPAANAQPLTPNPAPAAQGDLNPEAPTPNTPPPTPLQQFAEPTTTPEIYAERLRDELGPIIDSWLAQIFETLDESPTLQEFAEALDRMYPELGSREFTAILEGAMQSTRLAARYEVSEGE